VRNGRTGDTEPQKKKKEEKRMTLERLKNGEVKKRLISYNNICHLVLVQ
jgi:hypothetical protein